MSTTPSWQAKGELPVFTQVFCPDVGNEVAVDGICHYCGSSDHEEI